MKLQQLINELAEGLGDFADHGGPLSFNRWSVPTLAGFVHEARCTIATIYRRKEHTAVLDIRVPAGAVHDLTAHGSVLMRVLAVIDATGKVVQEIKTSANSKRDWGALWPAATPAEPAWAPETFTVTKVQGTDTIVMVDPPIPTACEYKLRVVMQGVPPTEWQLTDEIDTCQYLGAIRAYVMSAALGAQVESPAALTYSSDHMKRFLGFMGALKMTDAEVAREAQ